MTKTILVFATILMSQTVFAARVINVTGNGQASAHCTPAGGSMCLNNVKNQATMEAERQARWACEMNNQGRSRTYTLFTSATCNPSYVPPGNNGTFVSCRANSRMQCELRD